MNNNNLIKQLVNSHYKVIKNKYGSIKSRGLINYSNKKIRPQKGTGKARISTKSSPIFIGGGNTHTKYSKIKKHKINKVINNKGLNLQLTYTNTYIYKTVFITNNNSIDINYNKYINIFKSIINKVNLIYILNINSYILYSNTIITI